MPAFSTRILSNLRDLRDYAQAWDDLWYRSALTSPTMRAELFATHLEHFSPQARIWCPVVEDQHGRPLAALPLVETRFSLLTCGGFPSNQWCGSGDLLLDEAANADAACDTLLAALAHAPWPLFWFDWVAYEEPRWQTLFAALRRINADWETRPSFQVGCVSTTGDWHAYRESWSRNHRRNMARCIKRLDDQGELTTEFLTGLTRTEVERPLREAFEVENRNWKGEQGTSVLQSEGIWKFYLAQACQLADWGQLNVNLLRLAGRPIAAEYGFTAKGTYHPCKIGYDGHYRKESPGKVLHMRVLEHCFLDPVVEQVDFSGPLTKSDSSWLGESYTVGRLMFAPKSYFGRAVMGAYRHVWPAVKRLRGQREEAVTLASVPT